MYARIRSCAARILFKSISTECLRDRIWDLDVLGARPDSDQSSWNLAQNRKVLKQSRQQRQVCAFASLATSDDVFMHEDLQVLNYHGWPFTTLLHDAEISG